MNWEVEKAVWWRAFKSLLQMQPQDCGLLMTEPLFNLPSIQALTLQVCHRPVPLPLNVPPDVPFRKTLWTRAWMSLVAFPGHDIRMQAVFFSEEEMSSGNCE